MKYLLSLITACLVTFTGCDEQNRCYESVNTQVVISLKNSNFSVYKGVVIYGVDRNAAGDTLVIDTLSSQSKRFALPLSLSADSTGYVFKIGNVNDTIYFHHTMDMQFISQSCGFAPKYSIDSTSFNSGIDSVRILDPAVTTKSIEKNINDQNIIIYFNSAFR